MSDTPKCARCGDVHHDEPLLNLVYCEGPTCECPGYVPPKEAHP